MNDFLGLPGHVNTPAQLPGRPSQQPGLARLPGADNRPGVDQRPGVAERPGVEQRPGVANRPGIGQRPETGQRPNLTDRPTTLPANNYDNIRDRWQNRPNPPFNRDWWQNGVTGGRWYGSWYANPGYWAWGSASAVALSSWLPWGWNANEPVYYDYGTTVIYEDGNVYRDNEQVASAEEYAEQANAIAASVPQDVQEDKVEWLPLGVFAISEQNAKDSGMLMQLAVSKEGIIAGTYYNDTSGTNRPVEGMVDRETQRAAWKFADEKQQEVVFETGINDLTRDESTCLVHFGPEKTQTWTMVRVPAPADNSASGG